MEQIVRAFSRVANSDAVINTILGGAFVALAARSMQQQRFVEKLEAEKETFLKRNKDIKKTIWDSKQTLYEEAEANPQKALVPLSTLRVIYGEVTPASPVFPGGDVMQGGQPSKSEIMI